MATSVPYTPPAMHSDDYVFSSTRTHWLTKPEMLLARRSPKHKRRIFRAIGWQDGDVAQTFGVESLGLCAHPRARIRFEMPMGFYANIVCKQPGHNMRLVL